MTKSILMRNMLALLLVSGAVPALAAEAEQPSAEQPSAEQPDTATRQEPAELEPLVVTGSRIQRADLVSSSPVIQVDAEDLAFQGTVRVEDMLRTLPQLYSAQNASQSHGSTGTATLDLRNLGAHRTLVLINGRRLPAGSALDGGVGADINQIPGALIKNVEVLTGGSSATYGSDAVAGVVNFRMVDDFEGIKLDYQFSQYQHDNGNDRWQRIVQDAGYEVAEGSAWDGDISNVSLIMGKNLARGNVTVYGTYRDIDPVLQAKRDYSSCALSGDLSRCFGSATQAQGTFSDFGLLRGQGLESFDYKVVGHEFVPREGTTYNYGPSNYFQRPARRWTAGLFAHYDLHDRVEAYTEFMFMDNRSVAQIAPSGAFFVTDTLGCGNPFLSEQQFEALCGAYGLTREDRQQVFIGRRNVEGGNRQDDIRHTSYRGVAGLRGDLSETWSYNLHYQYSEVRTRSTFLNDLSAGRIERALDAVRDPATGEVVCRSVLDGSDPSCVPWNIFQEGAVTQEMVDYLSITHFTKGATDQTVVSGYITGHLGDYGLRSPFAATGLDLVLGGEYRDDNLKFTPSNSDAVGAVSGATSGRAAVTEFFLEAGIPLVDGVRFVEELGVSGGYRYSDYNYGEQTNTFGVRGLWALNSDIRLRASFQRAVRGPHVRERFFPQTHTLFGMNTDPCAGPVTNGRTAEGRSLEECARSGVTASQFGNIEDSPASQYNTLAGGNPDLEPEEADTYSFGLVWTPGFIPGLSFSLDYYSIEIRKGISALTPEFILNDCLDGNLSLCDKVKRGPAGDLWLQGPVEERGHIVSLVDNFAVEKVRGYDITSGYDLGLGRWGRLRFNHILSILSTWDQQELAGGPKVSCDGKWGATCGFPTPDIRNNLRATWVTPWGLRPSLMWRYISSVEDLNTNRAHMSARSYFDFAAIWNYNEYTSIRVGVNNLLDKAPPIVGETAEPSIYGNGNTFPGLYDGLGRYWFVGVSVGIS